MRVIYRKLHQKIPLDHPIDGTKETETQEGNTMSVVPSTNEVEGVGQVL